MQDEKKLVASGMELFQKHGVNGLARLIHEEWRPQA